MKLKTKGINWLRLTLQWGVILLILILAFLPDLTKIGTPDFEAYCPFGGLQALGSYLLNQALSCTMTSTQIVMGIILFVGVLIFSKLFCSFICPVGTVSEWLGKLGNKLKIRFTITGIADKALRSLKYILLFFTVYYTLQSNELFCKKYDPYYAVATGFSIDVVILYAIIALVLVIFGSIFIRLFWCKYLCPLGALSNIFKFSIFFVATLAIYLILLKFGVRISYVYPLAVACTGGYIIELLGQKSRFFPLAKITRNTSSCTDCQLCTKQCPQGIDVAGVETVKDVDCNLCGDCLLVCSVKNTLTINKRKEFKWLPIFAIVVLVTLGIIMGNVWEIPTIDLKWYGSEEMADAGVFTQSGLKNVKCYGSSMAFANKMKQLDGVYGVATYVKRHGVKIYYDKEKLNEEKIQEQLFTPQKKPIKTLAKGIETVYCVSLKLENFFDSFDFSYLSILLQQKTNAVGIISEFDCPVIVKIYFPEEIKDKDELRSIIESATLTYNTTNGPTTVDLKFKVSGNPKYYTVSKGEYIENMFTAFEKSFNHKNDYTNDVIKTYYLPLGKNRALRNKFSYIVSHLSNNNGIVGFRTKLDDNLKEVAEISYIDSITNITNITNALLSDSLNVSYSNGKKGKVGNMFDFSEELKDSIIGK
ncbi:MAG: 4Fe-4S binding protein [Draconibacterium sp.]|nr:4Fe-4S binding protein [Draconibacterium sp.]